MRILLLLSPILIPVFFLGCGGGGAESESSAISKLAASEECLTCHIEALSPGTGSAIAGEWQASAHNTANGAGCADCHEPAPGHPNLCDSCHGGGGKPTSDEVSRNPDAAGKCLKCHGLSFPNDLMVRMAPQHFGNMTASTLNTSYRASYVSSAYIGNCRFCHNPHNPTKAMSRAREWAESGLGNTASGAFRYDFKTMGTTLPASATLQSYCVRCHTTTGFINFVSPDVNGLRFNALQAWGIGSDKTKQAINCDACHDNGKGASYSFAVRSVPAVTTYYNYSAANGPVSLKLKSVPVNFPDFGTSNVCVPCHAGRGVAQVIKDAAALGLNFSNASNVPAAHYRPAAGIVGEVSGYEFPGLSYATPGYLHSSIGIGNSFGTGNSGPCIGCHMKGGESHSFLPVTLDPATRVITGITTPICLKCHNGAMQPAWDVASLQAKRDGFSAALAILNLLRYQPGTTKNVFKYPTPTGAKNPNWDLLSPGNGANTMGAAFNFSLLTGDPAAFAHNALYAKRLIYDSIDWLGDGMLNNNVEAAVNGAVLIQYYSSSATPPSYQGYWFLRNPITSVFYINYQVQQDASSAAAFAKVKTDAINYLLGGPGLGRP